MKAVVMAGGEGTRLRPLTHTRAKAAVPVAGRPVLGHILAYLASQGFTEIGIVISPEQAELKRLPIAPEGQRLTYIVQRRPKGIAHAVQTARRFIASGLDLIFYIARARVSMPKSIADYAARCRSFADAGAPDLALVERVA